MSFSFENKKIFQIKSIVIVSLFLLSSIAMVLPLINTSTSVPVNSTSIIPNASNLMGQSSIVNSVPNINANNQLNYNALKSSLDPALFNWVNSSIPLNTNLYQFDSNNNPIITVFAQPGSNLQAINENMKISSFVDLGSYGYIILGSIPSVQNLIYMTESNPYIRVSSDPYANAITPKSLSGSSIQSNAYAQSPSITNNGMFINQANTMNCGGASCNGTGVTIAMVDGGTDFGNSDLSSALALNSQGLPKSFDTEGWSLVATPLTVGKDIPISPNNTTLLFSKVNSTTLDKLKINDPGDVASLGHPQLDLARGWEYWHNQENFMSPRDWTINPSWIDQPNQAPPKFGVGVEQWQDIETGKNYVGYFYALLLDVNHDHMYDSVVIDMATSAWATYLKYVSDGGSVIPSQYISPDFNFSNDKVVTWETNTQRTHAATGSDYTFAIDWNGDGINDWSYGSLANAYNRYNFLPVNQTLYGKVIHGVDPLGSGFAALYPFGYGFAEHGTWTASVAVSRGLVNYNVFSNNTNSWDYPYGNRSTRTLPGAASGASLMSVTFGATPQDELLAWLWAAGFNLNTTIDQNTIGITGAQWKWSGQVRANITSNSWGVGGLYWGGFWGTDWISDLLSLPNLGGGASYMRNINDIYSKDVMTGAVSGSNLQNINSSSTFIPFTNVNTNNVLYIGANNPYIGVGLNISIPDTSGLTIGSYEYYTGSEWKSLIVSQNPDLTSSGLTWLKFTEPTNWNLSNITQGGNKLYWIRLIVSQVSVLTVANLYLSFPNQYYGYPGMLMVAAAGNDGNYQSTASPFGTLTLKVGATSSSLAYANQYGPNWASTTDQMAYFSSAGPKSNGVPGVDVVAPGFFVYSGTPLYRSIIGSKLSGGDISEFGGNGTNAFVIWAGTSSSTPAVAGVAAIAYQAYIAQHPGVTVSPNVIKQIIKSTATNLHYPSNIQGTGLVNASAIVTYIQQGNASNYFLIGSNTTYEDQLNISSWLSNSEIGPLSWYYFYSAGDPYADPYDFPVSHSSLLSQPHSDVDLSTNTITQGTTVTTQVTIQNNGTGTFQVTPTEDKITSIINQSYLIGSNDQFQSQAGDYLVNISLANLFPTIWTSDYIEITVTNLLEFDNASFFIWHDYNGNGKMEMVNNSYSGELARVQYVNTRDNVTYGILKIGNPGQYNTAGETPYLILRGSPKFNNVFNPHWAKDLAVGISVKVFNLHSDWSNAITVTPWKTINQMNILNVSINTTGMEAGFHFGHLNFTNTVTHHSELMPLSIKVGFGQIDQSNPNTNPNATPTVIGEYTLPEQGTAAQIQFLDGSMIWVPFSVNESNVPANAVLAIRVTQISSGNASIGFVLHYDETPNDFDTNWFQILVSPSNTGVFNGHNVNWQYIPWDTVGFGQGDFVTHYGYARYQSQTTANIIHYKIGLFTTQADTQTSVKLEMYWLPNIPSVGTDITSPAPKTTYCSNSYQSSCLSSTNVILGPNAKLDMNTTCTNCDPNLPTPTILFNREQSITNFSTGSFTYGYDTGFSVDYWVKKTFQAGDLVEFSVLPTNPSAQLLLWLFTPNSLNAINQSYLEPLPMNNTGVLLFSDYLFQFGQANGGTYGSFVAQSTGEYWFGIDNYGSVNTNWMVFTKISRGSVKNLNTSTIDYNTMNDSTFGLKTEATFDISTGTYNNTSNLVLGAYTPTGLSNSFYSVDVAIDNYVAPFVTLGNLSESLNNTIVQKSQGSITFDWSLNDLNGNSATSEIVFQGPTANDVYTLSTQSNQYTWDFSSSKYPIGWWTIFILGNDANDPSNTINGTNYGGFGFPVEFKVFIDNSIQTKTTTIKSNGGNLFSSVGSALLGLVTGALAVSVGVLIYTRRVEIGSRYNKLKNDVKNQIEKRRPPKEQ